MYKSDKGGRRCQRSETQHCGVRVNKCKYIFTWSHVGAAQSPPPRETRQPVPPGALWHGRGADCKHRTSRSGLVPGQRLYKTLHLHTESPHLNRVQGTRRSGQCFQVFDVCVCVCTSQKAAPKMRYLDHEAADFIQIKTLNIITVQKCGKLMVHLLLGTSLRPCTAVSGRHANASRPLKGYLEIALPQTLPEIWKHEWFKTAIKFFWPHLCWSPHSRQE